MEGYAGFNIQGYIYINEEEGYYLDDVAGNFNYNYTDFNPEGYAPLPPGNYLYF